MLLAINNLNGGENMNKKYMAILLIFGLLTVSLFAVSAGDVTDDDAVNDGSSDVASVDGSGDSTGDTSDEVSAVVDTQDDTLNDEDNDLNDNDDESVDENVTTGADTTTAVLLDDEQYYDVLEKLDDLAYYDNSIVDQLIAVNDGGFNELINALVYPSMYDEEDVMEILKDLDKNHLIYLLRLINSYEDMPSYEYVTPTYNVIKASSSTNAVRSDGTANVTNSATSSASSTNSVYKQTLKSSGYVYSYDEYPPYYEIYQYYLALYLNGTIDLNQLIANLEYYGIDTSSLTVNEDGSITFFGETSQAPIKSADATGNTTLDDNQDIAADADSADDTSATDNTDSTDSTETSDDVQDTAATDSNDEANSYGVSEE